MFSPSDSCSSFFLYKDELLAMNLEDPGGCLVGFLSCAALWISQGCPPPSLRNKTCAACHGPGCSHALWSAAVCVLQEHSIHWGSFNTCPHSATLKSSLDAQFRKGWGTQFPSREARRHTQGAEASAIKVWGHGAAHTA